LYQAQWLTVELNLRRRQSLSEQRSLYVAGG